MNHLPAHCEGCGRRVFLVGVMWCDEDGKVHRCKREKWELIALGGSVRW